MIKQKSQILCVVPRWDLALTGSHGRRTTCASSPACSVDKTPPTFEMCWQNLPLVLLLSALAYRLTGQYRFIAFAGCARSSSASSRGRH